MEPARSGAASLSATLLLTALAAIGSFSVAIYTPSMPTLAVEFATTTQKVKLTLTLFLIGFAVAQLVYGPLSDRYGRRASLLSGLALYILGSLACIFAPTIEAMIAGRLLQAIGACAGPVMARAVVRDVHGRDGTARILAWIGAATTLAPAIGPTLGGSLHIWLGWRANFVLLALCGATLLLATWRLLEETNRTPDPAAARLMPMLRNYARLLVDRRYLGYLLSGGFTYAGLFAWIAAAPFLFIELLGFSPDRYGMLTLVTTGSYILGNLGATRFTHRLGMDGMILAGCLIAVAGAALMTAVAATGSLSTAGLLGPMMLFSFGMGLTLPNAMAGGIIPYPRMAGAASALLGFSQMGLAAGATILVALLPQLSATAMSSALLAAAMAALAARLCCLRS